MKDIIKELHKRDIIETNPKSIVPPEFHKEIDFFARKEIDKLLLFRPIINHKIILTRDTDKVFGNPRLYYILIAELETFRPRYGPPWAGSSGVRPTQGNLWVGRVLGLYGPLFTGRPMGPKGPIYFY
jgi:hypothetical protein